jgi:hypothetical protein
VWLRGLGWALRGRVAPTLSRQDSSRSSPGSSVGGFSPRMAQNNSNLSLADMAAPPEEEAASTREQILDILALAKLGMWNFMSEPDSSTCVPNPNPKPTSAALHNSTGNLRSAWRCVQRCTSCES